MPRSNWKGVISFGLVSIPVSLYPAENKSADISFHQVDKRDNARIKYQRINANTGEPVPWEEISRGYEYDKNTIIPVPDEVLKRVAGDNARTIEIENFIGEKDLDFLSIERNYFLVPDKKSQKGYVILRDSLQETKKIGIAKVIISTKEYLAAVLPHDQALILCLLKYANEVRKLEDFDLPTKDLKNYKVNQKEIDIAKKLINSMSEKWRPEKYIDEYQLAVHAWVEESVKKLPHTTMKQRKQGQTNVVNFIDLLKKSLKKTGNVKKTSSKIHKMVPAKSKPGKHAAKH